MLTFLVMVAVVPVDKTLTFDIHRHEWSTLTKWMNRSLFNAEAPGINDAVVMYAIIAVVVYAMGGRRVAGRIRSLRPFAGFVLTSALVMGVYWVNGLKWIVGRARPYEILKDGLPFSHWFAFGPHFVTEGIYHGSFPSGHTAQMFILMTLAYIMAGTPSNPSVVRKAGWVLGLLCLGLSLAMATARSMALSHWISDGLGSILFGWIIMHWLYHTVLRIPEQQRCHRATDGLPKMPSAWEIILCLYLLMGVLGVMAVLIGTRALISDRGPWLVLMVPPGAGLVWLARQRAVALLVRLRTALESEAT